MRKKISQLIKRSLAGFAALAMTVGCMSGVSFRVQAVEAEPVFISNYTSHISNEIVPENTGGDNHVLLQPLSAEDEFVFGADVTFTNLDEQQSAALIFGSKENALDDSHAIKANIHAKIDWNVPARVFKVQNGSTDIGSASLEGKPDNSKTIHAKLYVTSAGIVTYELSNLDNMENKVTMTGALSDYQGGYLGLLTFDSSAVFFNATCTWGDEAPEAVYNTNLGELTFAGGSGSWVVTENGLYSDATGNGLPYQWYYSEDGGTTWVQSGTPGFATNNLQPILRAYRDGYMYYCQITDIFGNTVETNYVSVTIG